MMNIEEKINNQDQATSLRNLMGKFSGHPKRRQSTRHLSRVKKLINTIRDERSINAQTKRSNSYLMDQISQRDLIMDDCYETISKTQKMVLEMEEYIQRLELENSRLKSFKGVRVVA